MSHTNEMIDHIRQEFEEIRRSENPFDPKLERRTDGEYINEDTWITWRYYQIAKNRMIPEKVEKGQIKTVIPKGWVVLHTRENVMIEKQSQGIKLFLKGGEIDRERSVSPELAMRNFVIDLLDLQFEVGDE